VAPALTVATIESFEPEPHLLIWVPPFMLSAKHNITDYPDVFGVRSLMDLSTGHLPRISEFPLGLKNGVQQVTASFTARGFRAGVVSAVDVRFGASEPPSLARRVSVDFNRPFAFLAKHRQTGLIVLGGTVTGGEEFSTQALR
jgi:hypothetical protein